MDRDDARLAAFFAAQEPPARDRSFRADVMQAIARRRFRQEMAGLGLWALISSAVLWGLWPVVGPAVERLSASLAPAGFALAMVMLAGLIATRRAFFPLDARS